MRTESRWLQLEGAEKDARLLARFAVLRESDIDAFRKDAPDFVPQDYWGAMPTLTLRPDLPLEQVLYKGRPWELAQRMVRDAWHQRFPPEKAVELISNCSKFSDMERQLNAILTAPNASVEDLLRHLSPAKMYGFQKAVMYLSMQPWRAKVCSLESCKRRYVANAPPQETCGLDCRSQYHKLRKARDWEKSGRQYRKNSIAGRKARRKRKK